MKTTLHGLDLAGLLARAHAAVSGGVEFVELEQDLHAAWLALREQPARTPRQLFVLHVRDSDNEQSYEVFRTRLAAEAQALHYVNQARFPHRLANEQAQDTAFKTFAEADAWADENNWRIVIESTRLK